MPKRARYFSAAVIAVAGLTAALVLPRTDWTHVPRAPFVVLLALQVLLMLTIRLPMERENPAGPAMISVLLAAIVLLPPGAAALTGAVASAFMVLRRGDPWRVALSGSVTFLAAAAGGLAYRVVHGDSTLTSADFPRALLPIGLAVLVLSSIPAVLLSGFLVYVGQLTPRAAFREYALRSGPRNVGYAFVGLLTAVLWSVSYDALAAVVLLGPVVVTRWATVQYEEQREAHDAIIRTLVQAVEIKDLYTRGHSERVAKISGMIAAELRLAEERVEVLTYAATLHDVGKLGVPTRLLRKTDRLDDHEFEEIRLHPSRGVEVVRDIAFLDEAYSAILHHHERMDGLGYPSGLRGMRIPPFARIIAVADAFDSMTSTRSYRGARGSDEALTELRANMGSQFDPEIVDAIAAALARAELAGNPWRGDGTAYEEGPDGRAQLADLPPGAVVAEFDHDDPAYQLLAVAEAEAREKPAGDAFASGGAAGVESLGDDSENGENGDPGDSAAEVAAEPDDGAHADFAADGTDADDNYGDAHDSGDSGEHGVTGAGADDRAYAGFAVDGEDRHGDVHADDVDGGDRVAGVGSDDRAYVGFAVDGEDRQGDVHAGDEDGGGRVTGVGPDDRAYADFAADGDGGHGDELTDDEDRGVAGCEEERSGCEEAPARAEAPGSSGCAPEAEAASSGRVARPAARPSRLSQARQARQQPVVPAQSRLPRSPSAPDQAAPARDGLRLGPFGAGFTVPTQVKRASELDADAAEPGAATPAPPSADPETESR